MLPVSRHYDPARSVALQLPSNLRYIKARSAGAPMNRFSILVGESGESAECQSMIKGQEIVFVVDDDYAVRESLKFALKLEGLDVRACGSDAELLRHSDLPQAGCLVMECRMPIMDGFKVLDILDARGAKVPVILLTSYATEAFRRRAATAGVKYILEKPLLNGSLVSSIHELLDCGRASHTGSDNLKCPL
jgi:two-component system response regulator FixJ